MTQAALVQPPAPARLIENGAAFVMPTHVGGEPTARIVILNPRTTMADIAVVLDAMC